MKKALKNIFSSALPQIINIITNLILPGLIIAKFGSEINGLVSTTKTIVSYISLVGAGIAAAVTQALYAPVARKDSSAVRGMLKAANDMFNKYGFIFCGITLVVSFVYPFFIKSDISYFTIACLLLVMSLSGASEFFAIGRCRALLYANQQVYVCTLIQALSLAISFFLALIMLKVSDSIVLVQFGISFVYVLRGFFLTAYVRKKYPELSEFKKDNPINDAISKRNDAMIHQLSGLVVTGSQAVILTSFVNLQAASIYSIYNIVFSGLQSICSNLSTAVTPFLGKELALQQSERLLKLYDVIEFSFFNIVSLIYSVTAVMILPFVGIYTSDADINYIYPMFATLFVCSSAFYILKLPCTALINIAGHFKETKWRAITEAIICVVVSIVCTITIGKEGVLIGTGCALGWRCLDTIIYTNKYILNVSNKTSLLRLLKAFIVIFILRIAFEFINCIPSNWMEWIVMAVIVTISSIVINLIMALLTERKTLKNVLSYLKGISKN